MWRHLGMGMADRSESGVGKGPIVLCKLFYVYSLLEFFCYGMYGPYGPGVVLVCCLGFLSLCVVCLFTCRMCVICLFSCRA